jgi:general secretion pathway protein I
MNWGKWKSGQASNCRGFTLLEVIVALGIVTVGVLAIARAVTGYVDTTTVLKQRMVANWVAANRLESLRILKTTAVPGSTHGSEEMADRVWYFRETTTATADPSLFRIEITVFTDKDETTEAGNMFGYVLNANEVVIPGIEAFNLSPVTARLAYEA